MHLLESKGAKGAVTEGLAERIRGERNEEVLKRWLLSAAEAKSVEQFRERENLQGVRGVSP